MGTRATRAVRGTALAAFATLIAAVAHTFGGGSAPSPLFCVALFAFAAPVATAFSATRSSLWRSAAAVGASQLLFHGAFSAMGDFGSWDPIASAHVHGAALATLETAPAMGVHADMTLAHVAAALVTIAAARRGERVITAIRDWIVGRASSLPRPRLVVAAHRPAPLRSVSLPALRVVLSGLSRRGPPVSLATTTTAA